MTPSQVSRPDCSRQDPRRWSRLDRASAHADFEDPFTPPTSQRDYAQKSGLPRSTLGDWLRQPPPDGVEAEVASFFRSPPGERLLRRLVLAAHLAFRQVAPCGL